MEAEWGAEGVTKNAAMEVPSPPAAGQGQFLPLTPAQTTGVCSPFHPVVFLSGERRRRRMELGEGGGRRWKGRAGSSMAELFEFLCTVHLFTLEFAIKRLRPSCFNNFS